MTTVARVLQQSEPRVSPGTRARAASAMQRAAHWLKQDQSPEGFWKGELETNVTMDAEDVLLRHFLGILDPETLSAAAARARSGQRQDGSWPTFYGGPGELSATVEAYLVLRLSGDAPHAEHMARAASWARDHGGLGATRVFTRIWLALVGLWDWEDLPIIPPELIFLPPSWPLSIYSFGCWARQTVVALSVVCAHRPSRPLPFRADELRSARRSRRQRLDAVGAALLGLDRALHHYEKLNIWPKRAIRKAALKEAERWIVARQEADGSWGGIQPPMVYSTIALVLQGYPLDHPVVAAALAGLDAFTVQDAEGGRRVEACQSPVWDTALAIIALSDAGAAPDDPALVAARDWILEKEVKVTGDWAVKRPRLAPGGWYFEFNNVHYPDIDDTAEVVLALRRTLPSPESEAACRRALAWVAGMQSSDGGWGAFDADNDDVLPTKLPFFDFGRVTDPPTEDVTAHVVEMFANEAGGSRHEPGAGAPRREHGDGPGRGWGPRLGEGPESPRRQYGALLRRGVDWLSAHQEADGSYWGRWGVNYVYGAGAVVPALVAVGVGPADPRVAGAVNWLLEHQNPDGGWGEDLRSYVEPYWRGRGVSTASQTAWALLALLAAGEDDSEAATRGIEWLIENQNGQGTWDEPWFTGTGFPWDFSLNYHLYRHVFPLTALGRYVFHKGPRQNQANAPLHTNGSTPSNGQIPTDAAQSNGAHAHTNGAHTNGAHTNGAHTKGALRIA